MQKNKPGKRPIKGHEMMKGKQTKLDFSELLQAVKDVNLLRGWKTNFMRRTSLGSVLRPLDKPMGMYCFRKDWGEVSIPESEEASD